MARLPCQLTRQLPNPPAPPPHTPPTARSNRSAALLQLSKTTKALADAEAAIRLRPEWEKGHWRKAAALELLERMDEVAAGRPAAGAAGAPPPLSPEHNASPSAPPRTPLRSAVVQALAAYQQALACSGPDNKQLADKVRVLGKIVERNARRGGGGKPDAVPQAA